MNQSTRKFNLESYKTPRLFETVSELVSIPGAFRKVAMWCVVCGFAAVATTLTLFLSGKAEGIWAVGLIIYSIFFGFAGGLAAGIAEVIRRSSGGMLKLVDLLFGITEQVATDFRKFSSGETRLPPTRELVLLVYKDVLLPIVENAVGGMLGVLGAPVLWIYRQSLGRVVKTAIQLIPVEATKDDEEQMTAAADNIKAVAGSVAVNEQRILSGLKKARTAVAGFGGTVRMIVMVPCYIMFGVLLTLLIVPLLILAWLSGLLGGSEPAEPETARRVIVHSAGLVADALYRL